MNFFSFAFYYTAEKVKRHEFFLNFSCKQVKCMFRMDMQYMIYQADNPDSDFIHAGAVPSHARLCYDGTVPDELNK